MDPGDPQLAAAVATVRAFLDRAEALRAVLLLDRDEPVVIDLDATGELEIAVGERVAAVELETFAGTQPLALPDVHPLAGVEVEPAEGIVTAPIGAIDRTAAAVRATALLFGGRSVFTAAFASSDPDEPLFIAARGSEPVVVSLGGQEWELPAL